MTILKRRFLFFWVWVILSLGITLYPAQAGDIVFIVNPGVKTASIGKESLRDIFLGNTSVWPDDQKVNFAIQKDTASHKIFVRVITRKTESQFQAWWKRKLFTGTGKIPVRFDSDQEMIDYVAKTEGGLGYVSSAATIPDTVKILTVTD